MRLEALRQARFARDVGRVLASIEREEAMAENDNTLGQLNSELFAELYRLRNVDVTDADALKAEVERSKAVEGIARVAIDNAKTVLTAAQMRAQYSSEAVMPRMLEG